MASGMMSIAILRTGSRRQFRDIGRLPVLCAKSFGSNSDLRANGWSQRCGLRMQLSAPDIPVLSHGCQSWATRRSSSLTRRVTY